MSLLSRLIGYVPRKELRGIRLNEAEPWRVSPTRDVKRLLRALPTLVGDGCIVYFEDTGEVHVREFLGQVSVPEQAHVEMGTIWPRPDCHHVPLTREAMESIATFVTRNPAGHFCTHFHVYRDESIFLQWYDAFYDDPLYVSRAISETAVAQFASTLGATYATGW